MSSFNATGFISVIILMLQTHINSTSTTLKYLLIKMHVDHAKLINTRLIISMKMENLHFKIKIFFSMNHSTKIRPFLPISGFYK